MSTVLDQVKRYQYTIEKYPEDEHRLLKCIERLQQLDVTVRHLEETGVGRTVNALRKEPGAIGEAARALVKQWKYMVAAEERSESEDYNNDVTTQYTGHHNGNNPNDRQHSSRNDSSRNASNYDTQYHNGKYNDNKRKLESYKQETHEVKRARQSDHESNAKSGQSSDESSSSSDSESDSSEHEKKDYRDTVKHEPKHEPESRKKHEERKTESSNKTSMHYKSSDKDRHSSEKSSSHKDKEKPTSSRHSSEKPSSKESSRKEEKIDKSSNREKDKHKHSSEKDKDRHTKSHKSSKEKSDSEKSKDRRSKERSSHSHKDEKRHSSSSDKRKSSENKSKSDGHKEKESSSRSSSHKSSSSSKSSSSKLKEDMPKKDKSQCSNDSDDGIDCGSGASFAEALGMISPSKPKKKINNKDLSPGFPLMSHISDMTPSALLAPLAKLAPLPPIEITALPEISPNYKPMPPPKLLPHIAEEDAINAGISSKNQRTKVYSGNKTVGKVYTLYELCVQVLQEHIDSLEFTGGVPYELLKPIIDRSSPEQLFMLEHYNAYLMEDTDHLWQAHCKKRFRTKQRQEMETWREMYMRCQEEQECKLKSLTANIKIAQEAKNAPVKQTKMAYVDTIVKPPRNIARKQAIHGTARAAAASPAARVASLANSPHVVSAGNHRIGIAPTPGSTSIFKPKKAPLMQKALQLLRGRKR